MRILVVDERFETRWLIAGWLSAHLQDVAVESAASDDEALAAIGKRRPDLVLVSHAMGQRDGIGLVRAIKALLDAPLVVVMTDMADDRFASHCADAGADYSLEERHLQARLPDFLKQRFQNIIARSSFI